MQYAVPIVPSRVHYISREKLGNPLLRHCGVLIESVWGLVAIERQAGIGLRVVDLDVFAQGRPVTVERTLASAEAVAGAVVRMRDAESEPGYDPVHRNCEHFARHVVFNQKRSYQVEGLLVLAMLTGFALLLVRE